MVELNAVRKNKINLSDYDYKKDIDNRLLMAQFSVQDVQILEEILFSSLSISLRKLVKNLSLSDNEALDSLNKLSKTGLLKIEGELIEVDKDMRKYYESQVVKFEEDFVPGMDYLQGLLKKPPIHVLPVWYNIPRTSNNIFDSVVEKYLFTPQIFQRYLSELKFHDAALTAIMEELFASSDLKLTSEYLIEKYALTREQFEEYMLHLEFNFVCCIGYERKGELMQEIVTPFHEWREYLLFIKETEPVMIKEKVQRTRPHDFSFVQDMTTLINLIKKESLGVTSLPGKKWVLTPEAFSLATVALEEGEASSIKPAYIDKLLSKLKLLKLVDVEQGRLCVLETANDWLEMRLENRALFIYRNPSNQLIIQDTTTLLSSDRLVREAEKSIQRIINKGWVYFDTFSKGILVPLAEDSLVKLKRIGKTWKYSLPEYTQEEQALIKASVLDGLFEVGVVAVGEVQGKTCLMVTPFGYSLFGK